MIFRELLTVYILTAMQNSNDHDLIIVDTKIDAALTIRKRPKAGTNPITRSARKAKLCDLIHLPNQIIDKALGGDGIFLSDIGIDIDQVLLSRVRDL